MTIELPDAKIRSEPRTSEPARIELARALYAARKISMSQAVKIAGMPRILFWNGLGERKIPRHCRVDDFGHDMRVLEELAAKKAAA